MPCIHVLRVGDHRHLGLQPEFVRLYWERSQGSDAKIPKGMDVPFITASQTQDGSISGTYNARSDNLERFWKSQFGFTHGLIIADTFYENVTRDDGTSQVVQFSPRTGEPMLIACLWSRRNGPDEELLSFAAITDEPEPEVAAGGHDRTIINIKPKHVQRWLNTDPRNLPALYEILDDRQHPYYEHRLAA